MYKASKVNLEYARRNNLKKMQANFTVREIKYFSNISKGMSFLLQGMFETDPVARDVTIQNSYNRYLKNIG